MQQALTVNKKSCCLAHAFNGGGGWLQCWRWQGAPCSQLFLFLSCVTVGGRVCRFVCVQTIPREVKRGVYCDGDAALTERIHTLHTARRLYVLWPATKTKSFELNEGQSHVVSSCVSSFFFLIRLLRPLLHIPSLMASSPSAFYPSPAPFQSLRVSLSVNKQKANNSVLQPSAAILLPWCMEHCLLASMSGCHGRAYLPY